MDRAARIIQIWWRNLFKSKYEDPMCMICRKQPEESFGYCSDCFKFERRRLRDW